MSSSATPSSITGGCLCRGVRYTINYPSDFDFSKAVITCQCAQCRAQTGSLIFRVQDVPLSAVTWDADSTLTKYHASEPCARGFCNKCGSFLYWRDERREGISMAVGTFDQDVLEKYGRLLTEAKIHFYCDREIEGVTDHLKGKKWRLDNEGKDAELLSS